MPKTGREEEAARKLAEYKAEHPELYYDCPPGLCNKVLHVPQTTKYYFKRTWGALGWRFMWHVTGVYFGFKGITYNLLYTIKTPYFLNYLQLESAIYNNYGQIIVAPYSMKAFYGVISDLFPILGWRKRWYMSAVSILSLFVFLFLTFVPLEQSAAIPAVLLFATSFFCQAVADLYTEARYSEVMIDNPYVGSDIVSWNWGLYQVATLIVAVTAGLMSDKYQNTGEVMWLRGALAIGIPFSAQLILPAIFNFMGEVRLPEGKRGFQAEVWKKERKTLTLGIVMGVCVVVNIVFQMFSDQFAEAIGLSGTQAQLPLLIESLLISLVAGGATYYFLPRMIAHAMVYMFLSSAVFVIFPMDSWYLATPACVPDGPHFDYAYYITFNGIMAAIFGGIGVLVFQGVMSEWSVRPCFWVTTLLQSIVGLSEVLQTAGVWRDIGIPYKVSYFLGQALLGQVTYMMLFMPGVVLTSKLCPKGVEGTMYALLAGFNNFGQNIAGNLGSYMFDVAGIKLGDALGERGECNDKNVWWILLIGESLLPLICIPLTFWMIPEGKLKGCLYDKDGNEYPPADDEEDSEASMSETAKDPKGADLELAAVSPEWPADSQVPMPTPTPEQPQMTFAQYTAAPATYYP